MKSSYHTETRNHKNHKIGSVRFIFGMVFRFGFEMHRVNLMHSLMEKPIIFQLGLKVDLLL